MTLEHSETAITIDGGSQRCVPLSLDIPIDEVGEILAMTLNMMGRIWTEGATIKIAECFQGEYPHYKLVARGKVDGSL